MNNNNHSYLPKFKLISNYYNNKNNYRIGNNNKIQRKKVKLNQENKECKKKSKWNNNRVKYKLKREIKEFKYNNHLMIINHNQIQILMDF